MKKYDYYYKIADIKIHIKIPYKLNVQEESKEFLEDINKEEIFVEFIDINKPIEVKGKKVFENIIDVYKVKNRFIHALLLEPKGDAYAWLIPKNDFHYEVKYLRYKKQYLDYSRNILRVINIEQILNKKYAFMLHSSFIKYNGKAILFSAQSRSNLCCQLLSVIFFIGSKITG